MHNLVVHTAVNLPKSGLSWVRGEDIIRAVCANPVDCSIHDARDLPRGRLVVVSASRCEMYTKTDDSTYRNHEFDILCAICHRDQMNFEVTWEAEVLPVLSPGI